MFELRKEKLKWSKEQKRNKIFIPEVLSGTDENDCEQEEHWEMLINKQTLD